MYYVADTHSLIWYLSEDKRLGSNALQIFMMADKGEETIIIPTIVLAELIYICERKKAEVKIKAVFDMIKNSLNYLPYPLNVPVLEKSMVLKDFRDMHDRIIVATALTNNRSEEHTSELQSQFH